MGPWHSIGYHARLFGVLFLFFLLAGPAISSTQPTTSYSWARIDSVQLEAFLDLPEKERKNRAKQAENIVEQVEEMNAAPEMLLQLREATSLDPAEPAHWLALAEVCRWMGYPEASAEALASGRSLFKNTQGQHRKDCIRDYSLTRGWLDYEAGNWSEGEAWGLKAKEAGAGLQGVLLEKLNVAARPLSQQEFNDHLFSFKPWDDTSTNRRYDAIWCMMVWYQLHNVAWDEYVFAKYVDRNPKLDQNNVLRWRDFGLICEFNQRGDMGRSYYQKSFKALEGKAGGWLEEVQEEIPGAKPGVGPLPFWKNRDGGYVTGSLFAYAVHIMKMMETTSDPGRRIFWAEKLLFTATACRHRYQNRPWVFYWRGAAYLALDKIDEALGDLQNARDQFVQLGWDEPRLNPIEGHIYLLKKKYTRALPLLEQGVKDFPGDARCWSDLGVIKAAQGDRETARNAFDRALAINPNLAVVYHNRGFLNLQDGDWEKALVDLQMAADLAPHDEQVVKDLARVKQHVERERQGKP